MSKEIIPLTIFLDVFFLHALIVIIIARISIKISTIRSNKLIQYWFFFFILYIF